PDTAMLAQHRGRRGRRLLCYTPDRSRLRPHRWIALARLWHHHAGTESRTGYRSRPHCPAHIRRVPIAVNGASTLAGNPSQPERGTLRPAFRAHACAVAATSRSTWRRNPAGPGPGRRLAYGDAAGESDAWPRQPGELVLGGRVRWPRLPRLRILRL